MVTKAYDLQELVAVLKSKGLPIAETAAEALYEGVKEWIVGSARASKNPFDDLVIPFINNLDSQVKPQLDKIDGKPG